MHLLRLPRAEKNQTTNCEAHKNSITSASLLLPPLQIGSPTEEHNIKRKLLDILACPIDKFYPLELHVFEEKDEIVEGVILCPKCNRWYPIRDEIPEMLPDELREENEDIPFMKKWKDKFPKKTLTEGKPFNLKK